VCPSGIEAVDTVGQRDLRTPVGTREPQEEGGAWSPPAGSSASWTTEDQRAVEALLGIQPAVMLVTPLGSPSTLQPPAVADAPAEETLVSEPVESTVGTPRVTGVDSSAEVVAPPALLLPSPPILIPEVKREPDEVTVVPDSPARARSPSPATSVDYRQAYRQLRRQNLSFLQQLRFWAGTVRTLGGECSRPPTAWEQAGRRRLVDLGDWPATMEGIQATSFAELGARFSDYYEALLHDGQPRM